METQQTAFFQILRHDFNELTKLLFLAPFHWPFSKAHLRCTDQNCSVASCGNPVQTGWVINTAPGATKAGVWVWMLRDAQMTLLEKSLLHPFGSCFLGLGCIISGDHPLQFAPNCSSNRRNTCWAAYFGMKFVLGLTDVKHCCFPWNFKTASGSPEGSL